METTRKIENSNNMHGRLLVAALVMAALGAGLSIILGAIMIHLKSDWVVAAIVTAFVNMFFDAMDTHNIAEARKTMSLEATTDVSKRAGRSITSTVVIAVIVGQMAGVIAALLH